LQHVISKRGAFTRSPGHFISKWTASMRWANHTRWLRFWIRDRPICYPSRLWNVVYPFLWT